MPKRVHRRMLIAAVVASSACADVSEPQLTYEGEPAFAAQATIPGRFIVTVRDGADARAVAAEHGVGPDFVYTHVLNGFAGGMSEIARAGLLRDARVLRVEQDGIATASVTQTNATWGIDRIDQRARPLSTTYTYTNTGTGVHVYIIDTGILLSHGDFGGRAVSGYTSINDGRGTTDCNGHGTHVAGTVGGATWGVAKAVKLYAVRVLDCGGSGSWSGVIAGMDWVTRNHVKPAVANLSLGGGANTSVDDAVRRMVAAGVATAVAAGNGNMGGVAQDACKYSPARVAEAMTVGATTSTDAKTSWSNFGNCVNLFAPGASITSAWIGSNTATRTISGTSMAAPHVAGVAALHLQGNPGHSASQVHGAIYTLTTKGIVTSSRTAKNHLLFTSY